MPSDKEWGVSKKIGLFFALFAFGVATMAQSGAVTAQARGGTAIGPSGNPIPRFVSLDAGKVHMRTGPGTHYPIDWVYRRQYLPVEVIDEHGPWRKVRDFQKTEGWIHVQLLSGTRFAMIRSKTRMLFAERNLASPVVIIAEAGVTGQLLACETIWCRLDIEGKKGWIERRHLWGVYKNEALD